MKKTNYYSSNFKILLIVLIILDIFCIIDDVIYGNGHFLEILIISLFLIGSFTGYINAQLKIRKQNKNIKKDNPYIYLRELPNDFGIGVTTLLFDSTIENEKDIVAIILYLCAKKYLSIVKTNDKYIIKILNKNPENLYSNEKYIFNLITNNDLKNINYNEWYKYCVQDGTNLGIYYQNAKKTSIIKNITTSSFFIKILIKYLIFSLTVASLAFLAGLSDYGLFKSLIGGLEILFIFLLIITIIIFLLIIISPLWLPFYVLKYSAKYSYQRTINNNLIRTERGIEELHKLEAFKAFIKDFGHFVDRKAEEVVLWDYYLAYAQVFGLTKEIMKSGYKELVNNSSFQIDDINNIEFDNIEILL